MRGGESKKARPTPRRAGAHSKTAAGLRHEAEACARSANGRNATAPPSGGQWRHMPQKRSEQRGRARRRPARGRAASGSAATTAPRRLCASAAPHRDGARQHRRTPAPARVSDGSMPDETRRKGLFWRLDAAGKGIPAPPFHMTDRRPGKAARRKPRPEPTGAHQGGRCAWIPPSHSCPVEIRKE